MILGQSECPCPCAHPFHRSIWGRWGRRAGAWIAGPLPRPAGAVSLIPPVQWFGVATRGRSQSKRAGGSCAELARDSHFWGPITGRCARKGHCFFFSVAFGPLPLRSASLPRRGQARWAGIYSFCGPRGNFPSTGGNEFGRRPTPDGTTASSFVALGGPGKEAKNTNATLCLVRNSGTPGREKP